MRSRYIEALRRRLAWLIRPAPAQQFETFAQADNAEIAELISELGLIADDVPAREYPGWRSPRRIIVTDAGPKRLAWLQEVASDVQLLGARNADEAEQLAIDADAVIGWCTPTMIARAARLRWLQIRTAGVEDALRSAAQIVERGIIVTNLKRVGGPVIAEHVFAMLLCMSRRLPECLLQQTRRSWSFDSDGRTQLDSLRGRRLLVVGLGGIGTEVARLAAAFGMQVTAVRASAGSVPSFVGHAGLSAELPLLLQDADFVVNTVPLTERNRGLFNAQLFAAMSRKAIFVNVSRGATVVTEDLTQALRSGQIAGACLDVTDPEPLPKNHPLWKMGNVLLTPHIAGISAATQTRDWLVVRENLRRYVSGEPLLSVVRVDRGY